MKRWAGKLLRFGSRVGLALGVSFILLLILLTQTPAGKEWVLGEVLARVGGGIRGTIEVQGISSPGLLRGFTFRDVSIRGEDGRVFLQADSVRAGVSAPALMRGDLVLSGVHLWRPLVTLERLPDRDHLNVVSIFGLGSERDSLVTVQPEGTGEASGGARRLILLRDAEIHGGTLDILLPLRPGQRNSDRILVEPGIDGAPAFRRFSFRDLDLRLGQAIVRSPSQQGERFEVQHLAFIGEVWPEPFRVTSAAGEVRREGGRVLAALDALNLPNSATQGQVDVRWGQGRGVRVNVQGEAAPLSLEDIFFIEDRLPRGEARGPFGLELSDDGVLLDFRDTELVSDLGRIEARGGLFFGQGLGFRDLVMELSDLDLAVTDPWVADTLPLRGLMTGNLSLAGNLEELEVVARLDLIDPDSIGLMTADILGRMGFEGGFSATSLDLTLAPLEWGTLASISPAMTLRGPGAVRMLLTGSLDGDGLGIDAELTHLPPGGVATARLGPAGEVTMGAAGGASRVVLGGWIRREPTDLVLNLTGDLSPLSLTTLRRSFPALPLEGEYTGAVDLRGPLSDLTVVADLATSGGLLALSARFDARDPSRSYIVEAEAEELFVLSNLLPSLPEPTQATGRVYAVGSGFTLDALRGDATVILRQGEVGLLAVDSVVMEASVQDGVLLLRDLVAETGIGRIEGNGSFGVASTAPTGELTIGIQSESLEALRPFLMEEPEFVLDELNPYRRGLLADEGVDLDSLPTAADVAVGGSLVGTGVIRGGFGDFTGEGELEFHDLRFRTDFVESGTVTFSAENLPGAEGRVRAEIVTDSLFIRFLGFQGSTAEVDIGRADGRLWVTTHRSPGQRYSARGTYALGPQDAGTVNLDQFTLQFDSIRWNLGGPASFAWSPAGYRIRDFQLIRPGEGTMRLRADGFLPLGEAGEGDFLVETERLNLSRLAQTLQMETPLEGMVDFQGRVTGSPRSPEIVGSVSGLDLRYGDFSLSRLDSDLSYRDREVSLDLTASNDDRQVLAAEGSFPMDLRIRTEGPRIPDAPVDLRISADSFPAAIALAFLKSLEEVEGTLTGDLLFAGTSTDLEPSGGLVLTDGSVLFPALGVRHREVEVALGLTPDGVVQVDGTFRSGGVAHVTGTVTLREPLSDPELSLSVKAQDFLAVNRRDFQGRVSDSLAVGGTYKRPFVTGALTVEEGVLQVEEVARSVEVIDLSDPAFFDVVETELVTLRPIIQAGQNPFLQNLRLEVLLTMAQDGWLRGPELNVEMAGTLDVYWDRTQRDFTFLGVLDAVRGVYSVLGRQFQVEDGTVSFPGIPGINPDLNIRAVNRLRTIENDRLEIIATVTGSLLQPRVALSSDAPFPIAESDLVSYLIFGQPSYALASGQNRVARQAAGVFAGATASLAVGLFSSELGAILTKDVGLDYLSITQGRGSLNQSGGVGSFAGSMANTQVEIGQYLTEDIFAVLLWRPLTTTRKDQFAGLRLETRLSDPWTLEGYYEDRFLRSGLWGVEDLDVNLKKVFGIFLFREWGY